MHGSTGDADAGLLEEIGQVGRDRPVMQVGEEPRKHQTVTDGQISLKRGSWNDWRMDGRDSWPMLPAMEVEKEMFDGVWCAGRCPGAKGRCRRHSGSSWFEGRAESPPAWSMTLPQAYGS